MSCSVQKCVLCLSYRWYQFTADKYRASVCSGLLLRIDFMTKRDFLQSPPFSNFLALSSTYKSSLLSFSPDKLSSRKIVCFLRLELLKTSLDYLLSLLRLSPKFTELKFRNLSLFLQRLSLMQGLCSCLDLFPMLCFITRWTGSFSQVFISSSDLLKFLLRAFLAF